ncbi:MAG TPA: flagellar basal-body MS-ring/collar protein FliF [Ideonella sp.]|uniref:flagellar basal-body MS-ring/collar protein FliF n=1 Tax=Ideonella sp. TaxID=1929293 RepID=UPI002E322135|nr:flagellar basal-body MS-ring/collar protein FliF [Ideonella sp.]HEX5685312.1 flagellar basal-body MS-ring/collar protein FliF [Ideonella sp.]
MDATAAVPVPLVPAEPPHGLVGRLVAMPSANKMKLGVALAALVATVVAMAMWASQGDWRVLYAGLPDKEAGAIVAELGAMNVPYKYTDGGGAIKVPADRLYDAKMKLAAKGMPKASVVGNELLDVSRFGQTDRQERANMQRALEGELVRTISKLEGVEDARVHLALPNQNGFFREQQKASASVMLTLHPGFKLDRAQAAGIVHLVSSSVPELNPKSVSVLDQRGALISGPEEDNGKSLNEQQLQYVAQVEKSYLARVTDLLEPVVGRDNLRATVTADVDFTQVESTSEQFRPNQGTEPAAVRSQSTSEANNAGSATPSGVPGATSNQPPTPAAAPINGSAAPLQAANGGSQTGGSGRREATTNYEVDKTVQMKRNAVGVVKRLNAAVVVNHRSKTDAKGKTSTIPLSAEELEKLTALVQEAVGFNKERGDSVRVINAPFQTDVTEKVDELPLWKQPWVLDLVRAGAVPGALALVGLGLIFGVIRPALRPPVAVDAKSDDKRGKQLDAVVDDNGLPGEAMLPALEAPRENRKLDSARQLAKDNPAAVANIMREWVNGEAAA